MTIPKLNFLHRFAGRLIVLAANIHSIHYCLSLIPFMKQHQLITPPVYVWSLTGTFQQNIRRPSSIWGLVALICVDLIFFFSTSFWRQKAYNIFLVTHIIGFILVLPAVSLPFFSTSEQTRLTHVNRPTSTNQPWHLTSSLVPGSWALTSSSD